jgi:maltose phosphorylase
MKKYLKSDEWCILEEGFDPKNHRSSESMFSLGNGHMGQRANFEEHYSGKTLQGSYIAGIYYPDKTRVGWWKNGYPEYFAKVLNSPNWIGIDIKIDQEQLDLARCKVESFKRVLNMKEGYLSRSFVVTMESGKRFAVNAFRFLSMANPEVGAISYSISSLDSDAVIELTPFIDGDVKNEDSNYNEKFWNILETHATNEVCSLLGQTKKLDFQVAFSFRSQLTLDDQPRELHPALLHMQKFVGNQVKVPVRKGQKVTLYKYIAVLSSLNHPAAELIDRANDVSRKAFETGFKSLFALHKAKWASIWAHSDIVISGDLEAQQAIRFNIFHLNQTYTGEDERLNIGPKGFTGEKYGGSTYWDTEAYCIPFFISTAPAAVTRNLLRYRYKHLEKAIENGRKLGFTGGAALYPMVTMNGEECHNEWEITFEEIHRNGAIAFAIYNYVRHTGDEVYLAEHGLEVLIGIARFWAQRVSWSQVKKQYVILGVTGPNEYENNVNNNWYTNTMAKWCLEYAAEAIDKVKKLDAARFAEITSKCALKDKEEPSRWKEIAAAIYFPFEPELNVFLQQEGFMDKEQVLARDLNPAERPINQHWSWDRILRSNFIKQADLLQGIYLFEEKYDTETIRRHFDFYESRTVHESSLSPCVHAILAARIGDMKKAYELYLRTSRLDLDDYNHEAHEGLHITSMAGTWMSIVEGFGGKRIVNGKLALSPQIPDNWKEYSFRIMFHDADILVTVNKQQLTLKARGKQSLPILVYGKAVQLEPEKEVMVSTSNLVHQ